MTKIVEYSKACLVVAKKPCFAFTIVVFLSWVRSPAPKVGYQRRSLSGSWSDIMVETVEKPE